MTDYLPTEPNMKSTWRGELFRFTVFFLPQDRIDSSNWWEHIIGEPPEIRNQQPKAGTLREEGSYQGGRLILTALPDRADWLFIPVFDPQTGSPDFDQLPSYEIALNIFRQLIERWIAICPPPSRVAFGTILNYPVPNRPTGYRFLGHYLHNVQLDPENSSDFHYQINRRRSSKKIPGLFLNRLSKWAVNIAQFSQLTIGPAVREYIISSDNLIFAHVELDINTAPDNQSSFSSQQLPVIFSELVELASEIAERGDVP